MPRIPAELASPIAGVGAPVVRLKALEKIATRTPVDNVQKLVHELQVHQIELEMQNEELRRTHLELEKTRERYTDLYDFAPTALLTLGTDGEILEANITAGQLLGLERGRLIHQRFPRFIPKNFQDTFYLFCRQTFGSNARHSIELELVTAQSKRLFVHVEAVRDPANRQAQSRFSLTDISERKRAENALLEASQFNRQIISDAREGVIVYGPDLKYLVWNPFMEELTGVPAAEAIGKHPLELFPFLEAVGVMEQVKLALAGKSSTTVDFYFEALKSRRSGWVSDTNAPLRNAKGEIIGVIGIVSDITKRKQAKQALQESQHFAQCVVNSLAAHIAIVDRKGRIISVNERWRDFAKNNGAPPEAVSEGANYLGVCAFGAKEDSDIAKISAGLRSVLSGRRREFLHEYPCHSPTQQRWFSMRVTPFLDNDLRQVVVAHEDISERKQSEERIAQLNRVQAILIGIDRAIVHMPDRQKLLEEVCRVAVKLGGFKLAWIGMVDPDGTVCPVAQAGTTGYLKGIRVVTHDEPKGRGPVGTAIRENRAVVVEDINYDRRMAPWRERARMFKLRYLAAFPIRIAGKPAGAFSVYATQAGFFDEKELSLLTQVSDEISFALTAISDQAARKEAEDALRKSQARFKIIFDSAPVGIAFHTIHPDGSFTRSINEAHLRICGITRAEHDLPETYLKITHPDDWLVQQRFSKQVDAGPIKQFSMEKRYLHPDGKIVWVNFSYQRETYPDGTIEELTTVVDITERRQMENTLRRSEHNLTIFFNQAPIGLLWLSASGTILRANQTQLDLLGFSAEEYVGQFFLDFCLNPPHARGLLERLSQKKTVRNFPISCSCKNGTIRHVLVDAISFLGEDQSQYSSVFLRDITDRIKMEREILQVGDREHRRIAQDLHDGLGQLLAGTAYLTGTLRQKLAAKSLPEAGQLGRILEVINEAIDLTRSLARGLHPVEPEPNGLMSALQTLSDRTKKLFHVRCHFNCPRPVLIENNAVATHLFRIAQEAITNAIKHGRAKRIDIVLNETPDRINLAVKDNGSGIPAQRQKKSGMGLRIMRYRAGIIGGSLAIQKEGNGGTTVVCTVHLSNDRNAGSSPKTSGET